MSVVTYTIKKDGGPPMPKAAYGVVSIDVRREVGRIPSAELRIKDGDAATQKYPATDDGFFDPGSKIEILLRREGAKTEDRCVFKGVVVRQAIESSARGSHLIVGLKDEAVKLTGTRKTKVHVDKTDAEIIRELLKLPPAAIPQSSGKHENMVQYDCSDWDFIVMRAEALGMLVTVKEGKVSVGPMGPATGGKVHKFTWGIDSAYEIEIDANAEHPYEKVESIGWDKGNCEPTLPAHGDSAATLPPRLAPATFADKVGRNEQKLTHLVPPADNELKSWADARLARSHYSALRGRISFPGRTDIDLLDEIDVQGVGERLSGKALVTAVRHRLDVSGWRTDIQLGLAPERHCQREDIADVPAAGLLPPARGLQIGTVAEVPEPNATDLRVKVNLFRSSGGVHVWARYVAPDMGEEHGVFFRPQVGDEVLLGFLNDDPRHPVILGSLLNEKSKVPSSLRPTKIDSMGQGIVTKGGSMIYCVDGQKPSVRIETKSQHGIVIYEAKGEIRLAIDGGGSITLNKEGITIDAGSGNLTLKGAKVDVS
jgi:uncharacterized protein involved in type VI secretion and phage assembly